MKIDWHENDWFNKFYYDKIPEQFKKFWIGYYGLPSDYEDEEEYWVRCAFCFWSGMSRMRRKK